MIFKVGRSQGAYTVLLPKSVRTTSVPGAIYELQLKTMGVPDPKAVALRLADGLAEKFGATLLYFEVDNNVLTIQIEGSPFAWTALLLFLPEILAGFGILITMITVYLVGASIPSWIYGMIFFGSVLLLFGGKIAGKVTPKELER